MLQLCFKTAAPMSCVVVGIALDQVHQRMRANIIAAIFGRNLFDTTARLLLILDILASEQGGRAVLCKAKPCARTGRPATSRRCSPICGRGSRRTAGCTTPPISQTPFAFWRARPRSTLPPQSSGTRSISDRRRCPLPRTELDPVGYQALLDDMTNQGQIGPPAPTPEKYLDTSYWEEAIKTLN